MRQRNAAAVPTTTPDVGDLDQQILDHVADVADVVVWASDEEPLWLHGDGYCWPLEAGSGHTPSTRPAGEVVTAHCHGRGRAWGAVARASRALGVAAALREQLPKATESMREAARFARLAADRDLSALTDLGFLEPVRETIRTTWPEHEVMRGMAACALGSIRLASHQQLAFRRFIGSCSRPTGWTQRDHLYVSPNVRMRNWLNDYPFRAPGDARTNIEDFGADFRGPRETLELAARSLSDGLDAVCTGRLTAAVLDEGGWSDLEELLALHQPDASWRSVRVMGVTHRLRVIRVPVTLAELGRSTGCLQPVRRRATG